MTELLFNMADRVGSFYPNVDELKDSTRVEFVVRTLFDRLYAIEARLARLEEAISRGQVEIRRKETP
jgi:hypothetical protein